MPSDAGTKPDSLAPRSLLTDREATSLGSIYEQTLLCRLGESRLMVVWMKLPTLS